MDFCHNPYRCCPLRVGIHVCTRVHVGVDSSRLRCHVNHLPGVCRELALGR